MFSLIFDFSVYLENSSRITFPPLGWGTIFQVLKVSEGTCTVLRTVGRGREEGRGQGREADREAGRGAKKAGKRAGRRAGKRAGSRAC